MFYSLTTKIIFLKSFRANHTLFWCVSFIRIIVLWLYFDLHLTGPTYFMLANFALEQSTVFREIAHAESTVLIQTGTVPPLLATKGTHARTFFKTILHLTTIQTQ